jgi:hypothetical protein
VEAMNIAQTDDHAKTEQKCQQEQENKIGSP